MRVAGTPAAAAIALVMSADKENDPDVVGINAAGCALALSDIPFGATVGAVRIGRINGEFIVNPTYAERKESTMNIIVVGHKDGITMIESGAKEESEENILAAIEFAHEEIKKIAAAIDELVALAGERLRPPGWTEISAVATHPGHRGQGLGTLLVRTVMATVARRGQRPVLHAAADNTVAIRLYLALGFSVRRESRFVVARAPDTGAGTPTAPAP